MKVFLIALYPLLIIGYDVLVYTHPKKFGKTISEVVLASSRRRPVIAALLGFLVGFLMCHFFMPQYIYVPDPGG